MASHPYDKKVKKLFLNNHLKQITLTPTVHVHVLALIK